MRLVLSMVPVYSFWPDQVGEPMPPWANWGWCWASDLVSYINRSYPVNWTVRDLIDRFVVPAEELQPELRKKFRLSVLLPEEGVVRSLDQFRYVSNDDGVLQYTLSFFDKGHSGDTDFLVPAGWAKNTLLFELALGTRRFEMDGKTIKCLDGQNQLVHSSR